MSISGTNGELEMRRAAAQAFTLIELMVVIGIIVILLSLAFPVFQGVLERAKKVQAKNDLTQIVTAVNAFYTEYGRYPVSTTCTTTTDAYFGGGTIPSGATSCGISDVLFNELRAVGSYTINTRQIVFISPPQDTTQANPKGKIGSDGQFHDPWASVYRIEIDADYNNQVTNPYGGSRGAGADPIRQGLIAWSVGKDFTLGSGGKFTKSDDVISWQ